MMNFFWGPEQRVGFDRSDVFNELREALGPMYKDSTTQSAIDELQAFVRKTEEEVGFY